MRSVTFNGDRSLRTPVFRVRLRLHPAITAIVTMPETAVDKNHLTQARKNEVRLAWQVLSMKPKTVTKCMSNLAYDHLSFGVLAPDFCHAPAPLFRTKIINHREN